MNRPESLQRRQVRNLNREGEDETLRQIFVRDLDLEASIGAYESEKGTTQKIRINLALTLAPSQEAHGDRLENVICYDEVISGIRAIISSGHINLIESLAEKITDMILDDSRVKGVRVCVEKLDAVAEAASVGIVLDRQRMDR